MGGGIQAFWGGATDAPPFWTDNGLVLEPINGLVVRGIMTSDGSGNASGNGAVTPTSWTAYSGFAGQNELNDFVTGYAMCESGDPVGTQIVVQTQPGPSNPQETENVTATCPSGTTLVGGGGMVTPASQPSIKPDGSYPSDAAGDREGVTTDPNSWTVEGESGGLMAGGGGSGAIFTTALAVCLDDPSLQTQVVMAAKIDHPAGPGNGNPGSDPVAVVTATCPSGTALLDGGALAIGDATGDDGGNLQQGVHLRGSFPTDNSANPATNGAVNPTSWTAIVQSGGQNTPGTDSFAYALCATPPTSSSGGGASGGAGTSSTGGSSPAAASSTTASAPLKPLTIAAPIVSKPATVVPGKAGSFTIGTGGAAIVGAWGKSGLRAASTTLTATLDPSAVSGKNGAPSGTTAVEIEAKPGGKFASPLDLRFGGAAGNLVPALSSNGQTWMAIPQLGNATLPSGYETGYERDRLGTLHILTREPGYFALVESSTRITPLFEIGLSAPPKVKTAKTGTLGILVSRSVATGLTISLTRRGRTVATWKAAAKSSTGKLQLRVSKAPLAAGDYTIAVAGNARNQTARASSTLRVVP